MTGMYDSWDPTTMTDEQKARYTVREVGESFNTGRTTFRVICNDCQAELHEATNNPPWYMEIHSEDSHNNKPGARHAG